MSKGEGDSSSTALADERNLPKIITGRKRDGRLSEREMGEPQQSRELLAQRQRCCAAAIASGRAKLAKLDLAAFFTTPTSLCHDGIYCWFDERGRTVSHSHCRGRAAHGDDMASSLSINRTQNRNSIKDESNYFKNNILVQNVISLWGARKRVVTCHDLRLMRQVHPISHRENRS